jgi:ankyrin repeat protein
VVKLLIDTGRVQVNSKTCEGRTPLWFAIEGDHESVVQLLLDADEREVDSADDDYGQTPLSWAAENGHRAVVKLLLNAGRAQIWSPDKNGRTPLSLAAGNGHGLTAKLLLETLAGITFERCPEMSENAPVQSAVRSGDMVASLGDAHVEGLVPTQTMESVTKDIYNRSPLMWAAIGGHVSLILSLWASHLPPPSSATMDRDNLGCTLIHLFAIGGCAKGVCLLLDAGFDVNETDSQGWTPLHWAAYLGHNEVLRLLSCRKADKTTRDSRGWSAYQLTFFAGTKQRCELFETPLARETGSIRQVPQQFEAICNSCRRVGFL